MVSPQQRNEYVHRVAMTRLNLRGKEAMAHETEDIFSVQFEDTIRLYDFDDGIQTAIAFEMNLDLSVVNVVSYEWTDLLSELGGLSVGLFLIGSIFVGLFYVHGG